MTDGYDKPHVPMSGATTTRAPFLDLARSPRLSALAPLPAQQQPGWAVHPDLACIRAELADLPAIATRRDALTLRGELGRVAAGQALMLHVGECAELFTMAEHGHVARRLGLYQQLAERLAAAAGREVVLVARMAGQYAKPRSEDPETLPDGTRLPTYRGDAVNGVEPFALVRRADPWRMLAAYDRARLTAEQAETTTRGGARRVYLSHEALLRDYEEPLTRGTADPYAASSHYLWIGERTRGLDDWHVNWAATIANPIGVKLGPDASPRQVHGLLRLLAAENDSGERDAGRLTLITRMGARQAAARIRVLAYAVDPARSPVVWQCDPLHGNTRKIGGHKVRLLPDARSEISAFVRALREAGHVPGGLHLEVSPDAVAECAEQPADVDRAAAPPCDPRLSAEQAADLIDHFAHELRGVSRTGVPLMTTRLRTAQRGTARPLIQRQLPLDGDPLETAARLARAAETDYVVYEQPDGYRYAAGPLAEITLDARVLRLRDADGTEIDEPWDGRSLRQVNRLLDSVRPDGGRAYGWAAFELAYALSGDGQGSDSEGSGDPLAAFGDQRLLHILVPRTEIVLNAGSALIRAADERELESLVPLLSDRGARRPDVAHPVDVRTVGEAGYRGAVEKAVAEIHSGRLQKVILSRSVPLDDDIDLIDTYLTGRRNNNPARSYLLRLGGLESAGFCPEIVVSVNRGGQAVIQPLAGTRALTGDPVQDARLRDELLADPKEIYEHAISVLVACDDLRRVCTPETINVEEYMTVRERGSVQHLASRVTGSLAADCDAWDAFASAFPAVTVSGVPRNAAYASIRAHEEHPRGLYGGSVFCVDDDGVLDAGLVLRAVYAREGRAWLQAGAGIVGGSRSAREFEETCEKLDSVARFLVPARLAATTRR